MTDPVTERVAEVEKAESQIQRLSARVQGMMLLGQDRDVKALTIALAHEAKRLAAVFGLDDQLASDASTRS